MVKALARRRFVALNSMGFERRSGLISDHLGSCRSDLSIFLSSTRIRMWSQADGAASGPERQHALVAAAELPGVCGLSYGAPTVAYATLGEGT